MNSKKETVIITGCAGFIGSHAVDLFLSMGIEVIGIDSMTYAGNKENLSDALRSKNFKFFEKDIRDQEFISGLCKENQVKWIFNFAAETHVDNSIKDVTPFINSNVNGVVSLLNVCKENSVKLFHISTDEVYGSIEAGSSLESDSLDPKNPYSATKAASEHLIRAYANTHKIEYIIVRPSNNFGPRQNKEKFLPTIFNSLFEGKKVPVYGDGKNIRDWLYVKDNVRVIYNLWLNSSLNETYNITFSNEMTNIDIIKKICKNLDFDWKEKVKFIEDRKGHDKRYSIRSDKMKKILNLKQSEFDVCLLETLEFYRK